MRTPRKPVPRTERAIRLQGVAEIYDEGGAVAMERCSFRRSTPGSPATLIASWTEEGDLIEMKLTSPDDVLFAGAMTSKAWSQPTRVEMTLWTTAACDRWLLDGVYYSTEGVQRWMFTLSQDDQG